MGTQRDEERGTGRREAAEISIHLLSGRRGEGTG